jgi:DNA-binding transcriptional regulator YhcF (GntR family)
MAGFIKLHRGWRDCEAFKNEPCTQREAWVWLLENVAWKPCQRRDAQGALVALERGQFHTSIRTLAAEWQWSRGRVERFLNDLKTSHMIGHETGHGGLLLSVCNYDKYQAYEPSAGPSVEPSAGPSTGQAQGHTRRNKEGKEEKKDARKRVAQCPDGVSDDVWADFLTIRNAKRAPLTETAMAAMVKQAAKAGLTLQDALEFTVTRGWQAFNADWYQKAQGESPRRGNGWVDKDGYELPYA